MGNILKRQILIVEDDERMLRALAKVLDDEGAITARASWAADAMAQLSDSRNRFDLIITDLHMPFVKASTILEMIMKRLWEGAKLSATTGQGNRIAPRSLVAPVIVLTGFGNPEVRQDCLRLGAAAFLEKPVDADRLIASVEDVFGSPRTTADRLRAEPDKQIAGLSIRRASPRRSEINN